MALNCGVKRLNVDMKFPMLHVLDQIDLSYLKAFHFTREVFEKARWVVSTMSKSLKLNSVILN